MKKFNVFILLLLLFFGVSAVTVRSQDGGMTIFTIDPDPMVREPVSEEAMSAYVTGSNLMSQNRLEEAERYLLRALELDPEFVDAMDHLGIVYRRLNRLPEAEMMYLRSIRTNDSNRVPYINLAVVYRMQGRLNDAFELYRKLIEIDSNDPEGYFGIGTIFFLVENFEASLVFFDAAIAIYSAYNSPYIYHAYHYKGLIYYYMKNYEEALWYLQEVQNSDMNVDGLTDIINDIRRILYNS
ncbi:MAG: tetratricopeptide repeat protein [Treponema sp.]|nr:tetratricopeptide repeat protein [Treponema sp.]